MDRGRGSLSRVDARSRRALWNTLTAFGGRGLSMMLSLISVPLTLKYLDPERFGLWVTMSATLGWLGIADLGLGNGLTNAITKAAAVGNVADEHEAISTSFVMVGKVSLGMALLFCAIFPIVPWGRVFAVSTAIPPGELRMAVAMMAGIFFLSFPLNLVDKIYAGHQEGHLTNYWSIANSVVSVIALVVVCAFAKGLPWLIGALSGGALVLRLANTVYLFYVRRPEIRPTRRAHNPARGRALLRTGAAFLVVQLAAIAMWQNDNIIVAQLYGEAAVGPYVMGLRLGTLYLGFVGMWQGPLWPAYADASSRRDYPWIRRSLKRSLTLGMAATVVASAGVVLVGQDFIRVWTRSVQMVPSRSLLMATGAYMLVMVWCQIHAMALNGLGRIRGQMYYGLSAAVLNVGLSIVLGQRLGPSGVCWATFLAALVPSVLVSFELRGALRELEAGHAEVVAA